MENNSVNTVVFKNSDIWLRSRGYDILLFHMSVFFGFVALVPYYIWGVGAAFLLYVVQSVVAGGPHVYLTLVTLLPAESRKKFKIKQILLVLAASIIIAGLVVFYRGTKFSNILISMVFFLAAWHSYRQHYGILKIYDFVISRRLDDSYLSEDMKPLYLFYGLVMNFLIVYAFTIPNIPYVLAKGWEIDLWHPEVPLFFVLLYIFVTCLAGVWAVKKSIYDRLKKGKFLPIPQLTMIGTTTVCATVLYFILPKNAYLLMWIIPTLGHNVQYFGFVWLFEKKKIQIMEKHNIQITGTLSLIQKSKWVQFFGISYLITIIVLSFSFLMGLQSLAVFITYAATIFHYVGDGIIWKKNYNGYVAPVSSSLI